MILGRGVRLMIFGNGATDTLAQRVYSAAELVYQQFDTNPQHVLPGLRTDLQSLLNALAAVEYDPLNQQRLVTRHVPEHETRRVAGIILDMDAYVTALTPTDL